MKYAAIICLLPTTALAGGYAEPIYPPELIRPEPRPTTLECNYFLWWTICETENPSPKKEREDAPQRPAEKNTTVDRPSRGPAPVGEAPRPEPPAAPETPVVDTPPQQPPEPPVSEPPKVEPPKDKPPVSKPPSKPEKPKKDRPWKQKEKHHDRD